jgi:hypothetical protein
MLICDRYQCLGIDNHWVSAFLVVHSTLASTTFRLRLSSAAPRNGNSRYVMHSTMVEVPGRKRLVARGFQASDDKPGITRGFYESVLAKVPLESDQWVYTQQYRSICRYLGEYLVPIYENRHSHQFVHVEIFHTRPLPSHHAS